jgi:hypothetical protein
MLTTEQGQDKVEIGLVFFVAWKVYDFRSHWNWEFNG